MSVITDQSENDVREWMSILKQHLQKVQHDTPHVFLEMLQDVPKEVTDFIASTQKDESDFIIGDCDDIFMTILVE